MMTPIQLFPLDWNMKHLPQRLRQLRTARKITRTRAAELLTQRTRWASGFERRRCPHSQPELHWLYQEVDHLSDEHQTALEIVLDCLVKRSKVSRVMAEL